MNDTMGISITVVEAVGDRIEELKAMKTQRTSRLKELGSQIQPLWERLGVPMEVRLMKVLMAIIQSALLLV